jgi:hypothetical protein
MPSTTPLYTVIAHENGTVIFELSEELFQQALKEIETQRTARDNQYQLGTPSSVTLEKYVDAYLKAYHTFRVNNTRPRVSAEDYIRVTSKEFDAWKNNPSDAPYKNIVLKGPDKQIRNINLRPDNPSWYKEAMPEFYRYTVSEQNGQVTLKMDIAQNMPGARTGLEILKQYATNLLHTLGIAEQDKQRYPKIEMTGEGTKALYKDKVEYDAPPEFRGIGGGGVLGGILLLIIGIVLIATTAAVGMGIFAVLAATVGAAVVGVANIPPKKNLAWHENDLTRRYKQYFSNRSGSTNKPEAITPTPLASSTNAEASSTRGPAVSPSTSASISTPASTSSSNQKLRGR